MKSIFCVKKVYSSGFGDISYEGLYSFNLDRIRSWMEYIKAIPNAKSNYIFQYEIEGSTTVILFKIMEVFVGEDSTFNPNSSDNDFSYRDLLHKEVLEIPSELLEKHEPSRKFN